MQQQTTTEYKDEIDEYLLDDTTLECFRPIRGLAMTTMDPVSQNSNETCINGSDRHSSTGKTIQERANELFQDKEILAPMVRASSIPLRSLALSYGCDLVYTEEIVDRAITSTDRMYNEKLKTIDYVKKKETFSKKVLKRMEKNNEPLPCVLRIDPELEKDKLVYQIGTGESNLALPAATMVANDVDGIDINCGCPKKFSVSGGMGSALLEDLPRLCDIVSTLRRNLSIPVSCKIRLLKDDKKTIDFVSAIVKAGANSVAIHGREPGDESQMAAKLDRLTNVVQILKSSSIGVPIILNGDLYTRNDIVNMRNKTGADGVMLARPALYNTSIFRKPPVDEEPIEGEETRYGFDSKLLLDKTTVVQDYLRHSLRYEGHIKNIKYVVCEMMTNRRTPTNLTPWMPIQFSKGQCINDVCVSKTMDQLCKVWDVSTSLTSQSSTVNQASSDLHRYDDRYFLNPDELRKQRENEEITKQGEIEDEQRCTKKSRLE